MQFWCSAEPRSEISFSEIIRKVMIVSGGEVREREREVKARSVIVLSQNLLIQGVLKV